MHFRRHPDAADVDVSPNGRPRGFGAITLFHRSVLNFERRLPRLSRRSARRAISLHLPATSAWTGARERGHGADFVGPRRLDVRRGGFRGGHLPAPRAFRAAILE